MVWDLKLSTFLKNFSKIPKGLYIQVLLEINHFHLSISLSFQYFSLTLSLPLPRANLFSPKTSCPPSPLLTCNPFPPIFIPQSLTTSAIPSTNDCLHLWQGPAWSQLSLAPNNRKKTPFSPHSIQPAKVHGSHCILFLL